MKSSALQFTKQTVFDNKSFIDGNIADYLLNEFWNNENDIYNYLTDEEAEEMNGRPDLWKKHGEEIESMIKDNFNFDISEFEYHGINS